MPETIIEQYDKLIRYAEKYIHSPNTSTATAVSRWRNMVKRWLKANAPNEYAISFALTANPANNSYGGGITPRTVASVQKGLKILEEAKTVVPLLKKNSIRKITPDAMRKVFIVHGRDELMKHSVARFVSKLNLTPVILHEQPNEGKTIIEKFIDHSEVGFALVLLSGDDKGGEATLSLKTYQLRARQNVIFELGFFIGKLNRNRVVALYTHAVEIPSDYNGVLYIPFDEEGLWQIAIGKEMRAAGLKIDLNKL